MSRRAFTLIELLVVIAIIAILAAILFPVFAQAKLAAKKTAELSGCKQIGTGTKLYLADNDDMYPSGNTRIAADGSSSQGEIHWSWVMDPYVKNTQIWISPADPIGGWAPSCYNTATNNRGFGAPAGQPEQCALAGYTPAVTGGIGTLQVPRLSFAANQLILPRKRRAADTTNIISETAIDNVSRTILMTAMTDTTACMQVGGEFRTYRGALGFRDSANISNSFSSALPTTSQLWALTRAELDQVAVCRTGVQPPIDHIIRYANFGRFNAPSNNGIQGGGNNYVYVDGSAKFQNFYATFNTNAFQWGLAGYSLGGAPVIDRATGLPVQ